MLINIIYSDTGKIEGYFNCYIDLFELNKSNLNPNQFILKDIGDIKYTDGLLYYFDLINTIRIRPNNLSFINKVEIIADAVDSIIISNLPIPSNVTIGRETYKVIDGELEFTIDLPGIYQIEIDSFPYKDRFFEVIAI